MSRAARAKRTCRCADCVGACLTRPGRMLPADLPRLAAFVGVDVRELFARALVVDHLVTFEAARSLQALGGGLHVSSWHLAPSVVGHAPGALAAWGARGRCIFLDAGERCAVHPARPFECREQWHGMTPAEGLELHARVRDAWLEPGEAATVRELLGHAPSIAPTRAELTTYCLRAHAAARAKSNKPGEARGKERLRCRSTSGTRRTSPTRPRTLHRSSAW